MLSGYFRETVTVRITSYNVCYTKLLRPESVVQQVEPLRKLQEARAKLADLRNKLAGNEKLEDLLNDVLNSTEQLQSLGGKANDGGEQ